MAVGSAGTPPLFVGERIWRVRCLWWKAVHTLRTQYLRRRTDHSGAHHTCGLRSDETVVCWGYDLEKAARIDGTDTGVNAPGMEFLFNTRRSEPPEGERFTAITAGSFHTCGLRQDGGVSCWGYDNHGQASPPGGSG